MDEKLLYELLEVQEQAAADEIYMQLYTVYKPAEEALQKWMVSLPPEERKILEDYLSAAVDLHHRLMVLAIQYRSSKTF